MAFVFDLGGGHADQQWSGTKIPVSAGGARALLLARRYYVRLHPSKPATAELRAERDCID